MICYLYLLLPRTEVVTRDRSQVNPWEHAGTSNAKPQASPFSPSGSPASLCFAPDESPHSPQEQSLDVRTPGAEVAHTTFLHPQASPGGRWWVWGWGGGSSGGGGLDRPQSGHCQSLNSAETTQRASVSRHPPGPVMGRVPIYAGMGPRVKERCSFIHSAADPAKVGITHVERVREQRGRRGGRERKREREQKRKSACHGGGQGKAVEGKLRSLVVGNVLW